MSRERDPGDFQRAVDRLESAVQEFVGSANAHISTRATRFIDEAAERLERESSHRRNRRQQQDQASATASSEASSGSAYYSSEGEADRYESRSERRRRRRQQRRARNRSDASSEPGYRTVKLYRDTRRQRIAGVCAGLARYFGTETWVVRCIGITGVIFMPSIVIPAYLIAMFVVPKMPNGEPKPERSAGPAEEHRSPVPELGTKLSPRHSLGRAQAALDQVELKLRRMESYVTSGQYELQRELKRIDS
ncbi:MAG: PspC domain-containing protein [Gammaproteobacteria bacterium]|nr:PspC domain-containing protein [Gammaproteobacteria bacterium]